MQGVPISKPINVGTQKGVGSITIKNRELVIESLASGALGTMFITPTNKKMCPWLATVAAGYEKYRFKRLSFMFRSTAPTTASGLAYLAIDYDPGDAPTNSIDARSMT